MASTYSSFSTLPQKQLVTFGLVFRIWNIWVSNCSRMIWSFIFVKTMSWRFGLKNKSYHLLTSMHAVIVNCSIYTFPFIFQIVNAPWMISDNFLFVLVSIYICCSWGIVSSVYTIHIFESSIVIAIKILLIDDSPCILGWIVKYLNTQDNIQLPKAKNNIPVQCGMLSFVYGEVILNNGHLKVIAFVGY